MADRPGSYQEQYSRVGDIPGSWVLDPGSLKVFNPGTLSTVALAKVDAIRN